MSLPLTRIPYALLWALLLLPASAYGATWNLSPTPGGYGTLGDFATIPEALDAAESGDTIQLAPGIYYVNLALPNKTLTLQGEGAILDGSQCSTGEDRCSTIAILWGPPKSLDSAQAISLRDLTLRGGQGTSDELVLSDGMYIYGYPLGGGLVCREALLTLHDVSVEANTAFEGGGIGNFGCQVDIEGGQMVGNYAYQGGAMVNRDYDDRNSSALGEPRTHIVGASLNHNQAINGGAIYLPNGGFGDLLLSNVQMIGNEAQERGGAMYLGGWGSENRMENLYLTRNYALFGGAIASYRHLDLRHSTLIGNRADRGGAIGMGTADLSLFGVILSDNQAELGSNVAWGSGNYGRLIATQSLAFDRDDPLGSGLAGATLSRLDGNVVLDPALFNGPRDGGWTSDDDVHLRPDSPAVDSAGGGGSCLDPDGSPCDMGFYGGPGSISFDADEDGLPDLWQVRYGIQGSGGWEDPDGDGLTNLDELSAGTHPDLPDSDLDGLMDGEELDRAKEGADPLNALDPTRRDRILEVPGEYASIQAAIDAAGSEGTIRVGPGHWHESLILGTTPILLVGAAGDPTLTHVHAPLGQRALWAWESTKGTEARSLTLHGGDRLMGGTLSVMGGELTLNTARLQGGTAQEIGGNIYAAQSQLELLNTIVSGGLADEGGNIYLFESIARFDHTVIEGGRASFGGAGLALSASQAEGQQLIIADNEGARGSAALLYGSRLTLGHSAILRNRSESWYDTGPSDVVSVETYVPEYGSYSTTALEHGLFATHSIFAFNGASSGVNEPQTITTEGLHNLHYADEGVNMWEWRELGDDEKVGDPKLLRDEWTGGLDGARIGKHSPAVESGDRSAPSNPDGARPTLGPQGGPGGGSWDLDGDGYPAWPWPGKYSQAPRAYDPLDFDCDDGNGSINPGIEGQCLSGPMACDHRGSSDPISGLAWLALLISALTYTRPRSSRLSSTGSALLGLALLIPANPLFATTWQVGPPSAGAPSEDISTQIQGIFDEASEGDTVQFLPGVYPVGLRLPNRTLTLEGLGDGPEEVVLTGEQCLLEGETCSTLSLLGPEPSPEGAEVDDTESEGDLNPPPRAMLILTNLTLSGGGGSPGPENRDGEFQLYGGSLRIENADLTLSHVILEDGNADLGGALYARNSALQLEEPRVRNNSALSAGGALYLIESTASVRGGSFTENLSRHGAAIWTSNSEILLESVTVKNNIAEGGTAGLYYIGPDGQGGGLYLSSSSSRIENCRFERNFAAREGGAIHSQDGQVRGQGNLFTLNEAYWGGAIYASHDPYWDDSLPAVDLQNTDFIADDAAYGGALYGSYANFRLDQSHIEGTSTEGKGGALHLQSSNLELAHTTIQDSYSVGGGGALFLDTGSLTWEGGGADGNSAEGSGGAIYTRDSWVTLTGLNFSDNHAGLQGGAVHQYDFRNELHVESCDFTGNSANEGGGIFAGGVLDARDSSFVGNVAFSHGGAAYVEEAQSSSGFGLSELRAQDLLVYGNQAGCEAGGLLALVDEVSLSHTLLQSNQAGCSGGGASLWGARMNLDGLRAWDNRAKAMGGGVILAAIYLNRLGEAKDVAAIGNSAGQLGGGLVFLGPWDAQLIAAIGNNAGEEGGGVYLDGGGDNQSFTNLILAWNKAQLGGGGLTLVNGTQVEIDHATIYGNQSESGGGGLEIDGSRVDLSHSVVAYNSEASGDAFDMPNDGALNIKDSVLDDTPRGADFLPPVMALNDPPEPTLHALRLCEDSPGMNLDATNPDPDGSYGDAGALGGALAGGWDLDWDGYFTPHQPVAYGYSSIETVLDCEDLDALKNPDLLNYCESQFYTCQVSREGLGCSHRGSGSLPAAAWLVLLVAGFRLRERPSSGEKGSAYP